MASFSRGLAPRILQFSTIAPCTCGSLTARARIQSRYLPLARSFRATAPVRARAPAPPPQPKKHVPHRATAVASTGLRGAALSFAERLASKGTPTSLYEAPSHLWFRMSSFSAGIFCISYTTYNYWSVYLYPPDGLAWWVPHAFGVICIFMAAMGTYFILGTSRVIRSIQAVPAVAASASRAVAGGASAKAASVATKAAVKASASVSGTSPIQLELMVSRAIPLVRPKRMVIAPEELVLPFSLSAHARSRQEPTLVGRALLEHQKAERELKKKEMQYERDHLMSAPFRHLYQLVAKIWAGIRRSLTREGLAKIRVKGRDYKLDVVNGWALEDGRALDRLVRIRAP